MRSTLLNSNCPVVLEAAQMFYGTFQYKIIHNNFNMNTLSGKLSSTCTCSSRLRIVFGMVFGKRKERTMKSPNYFAFKEKVKHNTFEKNRLN